MNIGQTLVDPAFKALVGFLVPSIIKWIIDHSSRKKVVESKSKISDLKELLFGLSKKHPAIIEEEISNYLGSKFRCSEIILIMSLQNPMYTFRLLKEGRAFLEFSEVDRTYTKKKSIASSGAEKSLVAFYATTYFILALLSIFPLMFSPELVGSYGASAFISILVWSVSTLMLSFSMLHEGFKIGIAKKAIEQLQYKPIVIQNNT
jgi:hypothetical protein